MNAKYYPWILWPVRVLAALGFLMAGLGKLPEHAAMLTMFSDWGYPAWFCRVTGVLEIGGAILLLIPKTTKIGSVLLGVIMLGAMYTHLMYDPPVHLVRPLVFMVLLGLNFWLSSRGQPSG